MPNDVKLDSKILQQAARERLAVIPEEIANLKTARTNYQKDAKQCTIDIAALEVKTRDLNDFVEAMEPKVKKPQTRKAKPEPAAPAEAGAGEEGGGDGNE